MANNLVLVINSENFYTDTLEHANMKLQMTRMKFRFRHFSVLAYTFTVLVGTFNSI